MGRPVEEDLFSSKDSVFLTDRALVSRLAEDKLKAVADEVCAEGWSWTGHGLDGVGLHAFRRICPETLPLSEEAKVELKGLGVEYAGQAGTHATTPFHATPGTGGNDYPWHCGSSVSSTVRPERSSWSSGRNWRSIGPSRGADLRRAVQAWPLPSH